MQPPSNKSQSSPHKVKNILLKHSCSNEIRPGTNFQHPERSHILKYFPKYYKNLTLDVTSQNALLSKAKRIKKLRRFTGVFKANLPRKLWFNLLMNNIKEIEEIPKLDYWSRADLKRIKFLSNITHLTMTKRLFWGNLKNMRNLKSLEILIRERNYNQARWILERLNRMNQFLDRLEAFTIRIEGDEMYIQCLFQNKNVLSYLTNLELFVNFDPILRLIPQNCKNLKGLSFGLANIAENKHEFLEFFASIQLLSQLGSLKFFWPGEINHFWSKFKLWSSLRCLELRFSASDLIDEWLFGDDTSGIELQDRNLVGHWEEIESLDELEFSVWCENGEDFLFVRLFLTTILDKVRKLRSLKIWMMCPTNLNESVTYEPFLVDEVPHLYESLEKFDYYLDSCLCFTTVDLTVMKPFRKLKALKVKGRVVKFENVEEIVTLLQENQKEGEYPTLEVEMERKRSYSSDWFKETVERIAQVKRADRSLKITIDLGFEPDDPIHLLEELCFAMRSVETIKGLVVYWKFYYDDYLPWFPDEDDMKKVLERYFDLRNLNVEISSYGRRFGYIKMDGEKQQFY